MAEATGGRWNSKGGRWCASSSTALAGLETIVHFGGVPPLNRLLIRIAIPDALIAAATVVPSARLPVGRDVDPAGPASIGIGDRRLASRASAVLVVPSAIAPEDGNPLIDRRIPTASRSWRRRCDDGPMIRGCSSDRLHRWVPSRRAARSIGSGIGLFPVAA